MAKKLKQKESKSRHVWGRFTLRFKDKSKYDRKRKHKEKINVETD